MEQLQRMDNTAPALFLNKYASITRVSAADGVEEKVTVAAIC